MYLLKLVQVGENIVNDLQWSFNRLPRTDHKDGQYRLRRYSRIKLREAGGGTVSEFMKLKSGAFEQSEEYNSFQGGMERQFEDIEDEVIKSVSMLALCTRFLEASCLPDNNEIELHQMRIMTREETVPVSPEGVHQDGYSYVGIVGVRTHNIDGGDMLVYKEKTGYPFFALRLEPGEMAVINDEELWHSAKPIRTIDINEYGYMDAFILTAR